MPTVTLDRTVFEKLIGRKLPDAKLKEHISMLGTDLEKLDSKEIVVEVFPNRPDMLSEQGFARAFSSFIGSKTGLRHYEIKRSGTYTKIERTLQIWPYAVTCIVKNLQFNDEKIREVIQLQEKLATTLLRNRKKGGLGIYPLDKITPPITFTAKKAEEIKFRPLEYNGILNGREILTKHPTGRRYSHIIEAQKEFPVFIDAKGTIMSMPPIINSHDVGKIDEKTKDVFIEATGPDLNTLLVTLNIFVTALADMGGQIYSMDIKYHNKTISTPDLTPKKMKVDLTHINKILDLNLKESDIKELLERMGYTYQNKTAIIPAYRADILHQADLIEDIAIAFGYENFKEEIPCVATVAEEAPINKFISKLTELMLGLGLQEIKTYHLMSKEELTAKMNNNQKTISLKNAVVDYSHLRNSIIPSVLKILSQNQHHEYPQNLFEFGITFHHDPKSEYKINEKTTLTITLCHDKSDFTQIRQVIEALLSALSLTSTIKEADHPSFIPGRAASTTINKNPVAFFGEIHPQVLTNWGLTMPVSAAEIDVDILFSLVK